MKTATPSLRPVVIVGGVLAVALLAASIAVGLTTPAPGHRTPSVRWNSGTGAPLHVTLTYLAPRHSVVRRANSAPQVQIIKGAKYRFNSPFVLAGVGGNVWILNTVGGLTVVRASNGSLVRTLSGTKYAFGSQSSLATQGSDLWLVGGRRLNLLVELDGKTGAVLRTLPLPANAANSAVAMDVVGDNIWILDGFIAAKVEEVDLSTGRVERTIHGLAQGYPLLAATQARMWTLYDDLDLTAYNTKTGKVVGRLRLPRGAWPGPSNMVLLGSQLWIPYPGRVVILNSRTMRLTATPPTGAVNPKGPYSIVTNGHVVWTIDMGASSVSALTAGTHSLRSVLKGQPYEFDLPGAGLWYDGRLWIANETAAGAGSITVITP